MTTIAYDGKSIACDSRATCGEYISPQHQNKAFYDVGPFRCVMFCGDVAGFIPMHDWLRKGAKPKDYPHVETVAVCVYGKKVTVYGDAWPFVADKLSAFGSGGDVALGALHAGADARTAIRIAAKLDPHTGGKIQVFKI